MAKKKIAVSIRRPPSTAAQDAFVTAQAEGEQRAPIPPRRKQRLSVVVTADTLDRAKNAVYWTPGLTLAQLTETALQATLDALERQNGGPFAMRGGELRGGRPIK